MPVQKWISGATAGEIAESVESGLRRGRAAAGDLLPTVRQLAGVLDVSPATVAAAYRRLQTRGLIVSSGRGGTRVAARAAIAAPPIPREPLPDAVDLAADDPDPALLPPLDAALARVSTDPRLYDAPSNLRSLTTFAAAEFAADGIDARFTATVSGALDGIERALREHVRHGDHVAVEDPAHPAVVDLVRACGYHPRPYRVDEQGPLVEEVEGALRARCQAIILMPRAQNPTGAALTADRARDVRRALRAFPDVFILEHDLAGPVAGTPFLSVTSGARRWSIVRSTSLFLGPDLRVAFMAGDELTMARVQGRYSLGPRWVSGILQQLVLATWSDPGSGRRIARAADVYAQRRTALLDELHRHAIAAQGRSGLHVWVPVREEAAVTGALARRGWAVAAGERFRIASPPGIRVSIARLAPPDAARFAAAFAEAAPATALR